MITLKIEKTFVRYNEWSELVGRPAFRERVNHAEHELKEIIGRYTEATKRNCGLAACRTPHNKGYIVATKDGLETNIGHDCGRKYFDVVFEEMAQTFDRAVDDQERREALWSLRYKMDSIQKEVSEMRAMDFGADWAHHWLGKITSSSADMPKGVVDYLRQVQKERNPAIFVERAATETERQLNKVQFVRETYGALEGVECLYPENNLRQLLTLDILERFREFELEDIDSLDRRKLREWSIWANGIDSKVEIARSAHDSAIRFLSVANLEKLFQILTSRDASDFRSVLGQLKRSAGKR